MKKKAFITGINGQDGSYLSNLLVEKGYKVYGLVRRNSINEHQTTRLDLLNNKIDLSYGDLLDESSLESKIRKIKPDGCSKVFSFYLTKFYRRAYKLFVCNGILFNHESPFRGTNFVTNKIVKGAVSIKLGLQKKLELGNLDAYRDWGHSKDYVEAMHRIINHKVADDFVVASGKTYSVRDFCSITFKKLGLNYKDYVVQNKKYFRPGEVPFLKGDARRARKILKWKPKYTIHTLIDEMIESWNKTLSK
jgi:GDPmannose 4,6-dehydratase